MRDDEIFRIIVKEGAGTPTVPASNDHTDGTWIDTDIYEGELYRDTVADLFYSRSGATIILLSPPSGSSVNIYNTDGTLTGTRNVDLGTYFLNFTNGNINTASSAKLTFDGNTNIFIRKSTGSNGVTISAAGGGGGVKGEWTFGWNDGEIQGNGNLGGESIRMQSSATDNYIGYRDLTNSVNWYQGKYGNDFALKNDSTEIYNVNQVSKLFTFSQGVFKNTPLTTVQINAISSPSEGMQVYNSDRDRIETYDSSRSIWVGSPVTYTVQSTSNSPADAQTVYFGNMPKGVITTAGISKVHIEAEGVIRRVNIYCYSGTAGTAENWSLYIRINNTTDYLVEKIGVSANERIFNNENLNIPVNAGDYFEIKLVNPTWVTNPLTTTFGGNVIVE